MRFIALKEKDYERGLRSCYTIKMRKTNKDKGANLLSSRSNKIKLK